MCEPEPLRNPRLFSAPQQIRNPKPKSVSLAIRKPMDCSDQIKFVVPGKPVPQGRHRTTKTGITYTPVNTREYKNLIALAAQQAMSGREPLKGAVAATIDVIMPIPSSWSKKKQEMALRGEILPAKRPDWDNYGKILSDGAEGVCYMDDKQICDARVTKRYGAIPKMIVCITRMGENDDQ